MERVVLAMEELDEDVDGLPSAAARAKADTRRMYPIVRDLRVARRAGLFETALQVVRRTWCLLQSGRPVKTRD